MEPPPDLDAARAELERLRLDRVRTGRGFWTIIPCLVAIGMLALGFRGVAHPVALYSIAAAMLGWGVLTGAGVLRAPDPPAKYYIHHERIHYLEGFVAARDRTER